MSTPSISRSNRKTFLRPFYVLISLVLLTTLGGGQAIPQEPGDSTKRTVGVPYDDFGLFVPQEAKVFTTTENLLGANLIVNGGFENGFTGWTVTNGSTPWYPWQTVAAGFSTGFNAPASPQEGSRVAFQGVANSANQSQSLTQQTLIPASGGATLTWQHRYQLDNNTFCNGATCGTATFAVEVLNTSDVLLETLYTTTTLPDQVVDTGWQTLQRNLSAYAGQTIRIRFRTTVTAYYAGPGQLEIDGVSLLSGSQVVYMRSSTGQPWRQSTNEAAMNAVFGNGNWHDLRFESAVAADVFASNIELVFMEGGDFTANEMEAFLNANLALIESWVAAGGRLFLNSAPNEGNGMNYGFGATQLVYPSFTGAGTAFAAADQTSHPIFNSPNTPTGTSFSGGSFSHASIACTTGCSTLITSGGAQPVLMSMPVGVGLVFFGGMTTTNFHNPQPNATNLRRNILHFLYNTVLNSNTAPTAVSDSFSTDEDTLLSVPPAGVLANDTDFENNPLNAILVSLPANASSFNLDADGSFEYTPIADFNGTDSFTYKANDGQADSNTVTVTLTVNSVNDAPAIFNVPANASIPELEAYGFTASASDVDVPADTLTFSLSGAPTGASINGPTGVFSWTPTEAEGDGSSYNFQVCVSDGVALAVCQNIGITVNEVNSPPSLTNVPASATIDENAAYSFDADASDGDLPSNTLTFSAVGNPAGSSIDPSTGVFSWTPSEAQGNGNTYNFQVCVSDGVAVAVCNSIAITVNEVNSPPVLAAIADQTVDEQVLLSVTASATDNDDPANALTYSLDPGSPQGMTIDGTTGAISWTPTEDQGPGDYPVTVRVTDNGAGNLSDTKSFSVHVDEVNVAPVLDAVGDRTVNELQLLTFDVNATDADLPANGLTYSLVSGPAGTSIDVSTGVFTWTPTEAQGGDPSTPYTFTVKVTDDGDPSLSDEETITVTVLEVNSPPVLGTIANQSGYWGNVFSFTATATDPDIPADVLTFSLVGAPAGASINPSTGVFAWTPASGQISSHTFTVVVTDNGSPQMSDSQQVTINVGKRPTAIVYTGDGNEQYSDEQALSATLTDAGGGTLDGLPLSGKTVGFSLGSQGASESTDGSGVAAADLILTQDPAPAYNVVSNFAGDGLYLPATDTDAFDIVQEDARAYYTGSLFVNTACATCGNGTATLAATIKDITAENSDPAYDTFAGDIRNARVTFVNRDTNTSIPGCSNLTVGLVNLSDPKTGTATCNWALNIGSADSLDYTIGIIVSSYYTRNSSDENSILTVSRPLGTNFITGGGYLVNALSNGQYAGVLGRKTNFGFNVKYNKSGTNLQGRVNVIVRGLDGRIYQIKGNVMRTLAVRTVSNNPLVRAAVFTGKANITDITDPLNPIALGGNNTLQMELTDRGEPGNTDTMGITVWNDAGGVLFSSRWDGTRTIEQLLGGGNLVVR